MAIASTVVVFLGFGRTYYLKSYFGTPQLTPLVHLHGAVFTLWMVFFVVQTILIASNRPQVHRRLGYAGAALAIAMVVLGTAVAFKARLLGRGAPTPDAVFLISLGDIFTFGVFVGAGFLWRRNREAHQRLMLLAVVAGLLAAAIPRIPDFRDHPGAMLFLGLTFILAGPIYDLATRRRIHSVYIWGCLFAILTLPPVRIALSFTPAWHRIAKWLIGP
jgi:uncharacterized membrane protein YozB (DUF420 family)